MKEILFINRHNLSITGGIEMHIKQLIKYLDKKKYNITVLSYYDTVQIPNDGMSKEIGIFGFLKHQYTNYDIIFIENFNILPHLVVIIKLVALKLMRKNNYKVIFVPHGGFIPYWEMFSPISKLIKKIYHRTIGMVFVGYVADDIVAVSKWEKSVLIEAGVKKDIHLIGNGMTKIDFDLRSAKKEKYFIFVGRIDPIKDILKIIRVFSEIKKDEKFSSYKLYIIGPYDANDGYYGKLVELINRLELVDAVKFMGAKYSKDKYELLAKSQCLFCMSKFETDPIVVKESLSVNTKVCISPNYGLSDYSGRENIFTVMDDINVDKFNIFIKNDFIRSNEKILTWNKMSQEYEKLFD